MFAVLAVPTKREDRPPAVFRGTSGEILLLPHHTDCREASPAFRSHQRSVATDPWPTRLQKNGNHPIFRSITAGNSEAARQDASIAAHAPAQTMSVERLTCAALPGGQLVLAVRAMDGPAERAVSMRCLEHRQPGPILHKKGARRDMIHSTRTRANAAYNRSDKPRDGSAVGGGVLGGRMQRHRFALLCHGHPSRGGQESVTRGRPPQQANRLRHIGCQTTVRGSTRLYRGGNPTSPF
ncbi:hypothetical protein MAPG_08753 [Magnaporthiopsis poae ATCC 64411]|uniref:Uncharacterized protein n=1 Tax=Magnaporthiopsis poae (strain ATCC 64411 / 73-15) TaxID=644358 RepID=A0A0C4E863_MAGP6|nr:hypothetical protein MAPG_08753 [Magnaporthiopsis poae ATCC 64411]